MGSIRWVCCSHLNKDDFVAPESADVIPIQTAEDGVVELRLCPVCGEKLLTGLDPRKGKGQVILNFVLSEIPGPGDPERAFKRMHEQFIRDIQKMLDEHNAEQGEEE